jgi:hypothetical protein
MCRTLPETSICFAESLEVLVGYHLDAGGQVRDCRAPWRLVKWNPDSIFSQLGALLSLVSNAFRARVPSDYGGQAAWRREMHARLAAAESTAGRSSTRNVWVRPSCRMCSAFASRGGGNGKRLGKHVLRDSTELSQRL